MFDVLPPARLCSRTLRPDGDSRVTIRSPTNECLMATLTRMLATRPASLNVIESRTPAATLSGIDSAGALARRTPCWVGVSRRSASATAACASTRPWPNHGLQVPSGLLMFWNAPDAKGPAGEMSHVGSGSKFVAGVRGYAFVSRSLAAVCFSRPITSRAVSAGLAEITRAAMPATSGVALEVPPNVSVMLLICVPRAVVMPSPVTGNRRYSCTLLDGAAMPMPVP